MVKGLNIFRDCFRQFEGSFTLIGGAACDEWFTAQGLPFRATKDLDIVLIIEVLAPEAIRALRVFIADGQYEIRQRTEGSPVLYRFAKPQREQFPFMLEFFSRKPEGINLAEGQEIVPLPAIAGFAAAARAADGGAALAALRDAAEQGAVAAGAVVMGAGAPRLPNTTCLALPGVRAETQVIALDLAGVQVSAGAACSSGKVARSHVLDAMGAGALAGEAIRVSLPWCAGPAEVDAFLLAYRAMAARLSRRAA